MAISALEKIKITGQLTAALAELNAAVNAIAKVKAAKAVTELLARLGVGQSQNEATAITNDQAATLYKELRRLGSDPEWGGPTRSAHFSKMIGQATNGRPDAVKWALEWLSDIESEGKPQAEAIKTETPEKSAMQNGQEQASNDLKAGKSDNPFYQAYLDTLEQDELAEGSKAYNYMAFMSGMHKQFIESVKGQSFSSEDERTKAKEQFIRNWAENNLSERVKSQRLRSQSQQAPAPASIAEVAANPEPVSEESPQHQIIEYTTKRGKVLRGVIRTDLTYAQAKAIDEYTWKMNGGWFIRERHLDDLPVSAGDPLKVAGNQAAYQPKPELSEEEKRQKEIEALKVKAQKLSDAGQNVIDRAEAVINQDRQTNTARRAGMAAGIIEREEKNRQLGVTMQNLANGILDGEVKYLSGITAKAQIESLERILRLSRYARERNLSYQEQLKMKDQPLDKADADNAMFPQIKLRNHMQFIRIVEEKAIRGYKKFLSGAQYWGERPLSLEEYDQVVKFTDADSMVIDWVISDNVDAVKRLNKLGITNTEQLRAALNEYLNYRGSKRKENPVKALERSIIGQKVGLDFFPTPAAQAQKMIALANIKQGDRVLEPSAGNGNLADAAAAAGAVVDVIEISPQLQEILKAKGFNLVDTNFDNFNPEQPYDAIIMNPPWSNNLDIKHVMKAYEMLKSGGTLVAIMGEGAFFREGKTENNFREWLKKTGGYDEKLPEKTFMDKSLLATTSANGRMIVIEK